ncbi:unnamed protein product [Rhodiola kirilowii]
MATSSLLSSAVAISWVIIWDSLTSLQWVQEENLLIRNQTEVKMLLRLFLQEDHSTSRIVKKGTIMSQKTQWIFEQDRCQLKQDST